MPRKYGTFSGMFLTAVGEATGFFNWPLEYTEGWRHQQLKGYKRKHLYDTAYNLRKKGLIKEVSKNGKKFLVLTKKGQLETLLQKAYNKTTAAPRWDGKWRLAIFDIPEDTKDQRDKLRRLLKENGFILLQASVFVSPHPLNREAVDYLKSSGLIEFIRFARIDELDDDRDLKKKFKLA